MYSENFGFIDERKGPMNGSLNIGPTIEPF